MGPVFAFSLAADLAWWTGSSFALVSLACVLVMLFIRLRGASESRRRSELAERMEPLLFSATEGNVLVPIAVKPSGRSFLRNRNSEQQFHITDPPGFFHFLQEWNYLHESLEGDAKEGLNALANEMSVSEGAIKLLDSPFIDRRLIAINTLGNLRSSQAYDLIEQLAASNDPVVSAWAWRALMRIDTQAAVKRDLKMIAERPDWSPIFIAEVLNELDADTISGPLCSLVSGCFAQNVEERQMARLISYLAFSQVYDHAPLIDRIIRKSNEKEVLIACLRLIQDDGVLERVRELARDERWEVRLQAVLSLGRLGHNEDVDTLIEALDDTDWWVRYRAASVLVEMPGVSSGKIDRLTQTLPNQFARDILMQLKAEKELSCFKPSSLALSR